MFYIYLYAAIKKFLTDNLPDLKEIEWERFQGTDANKGEVRITPAVYIRFLESPMDDLRDIQRTLQEFELRLLTKSYRKDGEKFTASDANHFQMVTSIFQQLNQKAFLLSEVPGLESLAGTEQDAALTNSITRTLVNPTHSPSAISQTVQRFRCYTYDYSTLIEFQDIAPDLCVLMEIENL